MSELDKEISDYNMKLQKFDTLDKFKQSYKEMREELDKREKEIIQTKCSKMKRDIKDFEKGKIFTWNDKQSRRRPPNSLPPSKNTHQSDCESSAVEDSDSENNINRPSKLSILEDTIHIDQHHILQKNFRKPQKLNTRLVFSSFRQAVGGRRGAAPGSEDAHSGQEAHQEAAAMTTGDMLAIIFGILFMVTAVAFFVYVRRSKKQRSGSENKSNVIYKAATTEENLA
ncbi:uncharacterized protein LOC128649970 [Bombina bombina]|uniref:uncharacterized protein LOC128649970 n=1 Tax=Bombina bombina TaxID=8345 RepID=UPI00235A5AD2|nr:uncharacterized protein LOC128649970 [Bombina bombina]